MYILTPYCAQAEVDKVQAKRKKKVPWITLPLHGGFCLLVLHGCFDNRLFLKFMACCTDVNIDLTLEISMCGLNSI